MTEFLCIIKKKIKKLNLDTKTLFMIIYIIGLIQITITCLYKKWPFLKEKLN